MWLRRHANKLCTLREKKRNEFAITTTRTPHHLPLFFLVFWGKMDWRSCFCKRFSFWSYIKSKKCTLFRISFFLFAYLSLTRKKSAAEEEGFGERAPILHLNKSCASTCHNCWSWLWSWMSGSYAQVVIKMIIVFLNSEGKPRQPRVRQLSTTRWRNASDSECFLFIVTAETSFSTEPLLRYVKERFPIFSLLRLLTRVKTSVSSIRVQPSPTWSMTGAESVGKSHARYGY